MAKKNKEEVNAVSKSTRSIGMPLEIVKITIRAIMTSREMRSKVRMGNSIMKRLQVCYVLL